MRKHTQLYGLLLRPVPVSDDDSGYFVKKDFRNTYQNHMASMQMISMSAKIFILNNWEKVKDWSGLEISVVDISGLETYYYNFNFKDKERHEKMSKSISRSKICKTRLNRLYKRKKSFHNPVKKISDVVYDNTDSDFSFTINGTNHVYVDDETVIVLADYVEKQLNNSK